MPAEDPLSPLAQAALQLHEVYTTLQRGGFTEDQALKIIAHLISIAPGT